METITNIIHNCTFVFDFINILELILSVLLLIDFKKRQWHDYIVCLYGGFLFAIVPVFLVLENIFVAIICSFAVSLILMFLQKKVKTKLYIPLEILLFKILFIVGITFFSEQASGLNLYLISMFVSIFVFLFIHICHEVSAEKQYDIIKVFALLELSGVILQMYRKDWITFDKVLYDNDMKESVSLFFYLLKIDFEIFDYQSLYIMCFLTLCILYFSMKKVYKLIKTKMIMKN